MLERAVDAGASDGGRIDDVVRVRSPGGWSIELRGADVAWLAELLRRLP